MPQRAPYLLARGKAEVERSSLEARVWEPESELLLDRIGIRPGARCLDMGCGAMGILGPLSRRAGPSGRVLGVDSDPLLLAAARAYADREGLGNVELLEADACRTALPRETFDFVHVRFLFASVGRDEELMRELVALVRPGGVAAAQEPDATSWAFFPEPPAFPVLRRSIVAAFARGGGDFDAGCRVFRLLQRGGLQNVQIRPSVLAFQNGHPYMRLPLLLAGSLRSRILDGGILAAAALDRAIAEYEAFLRKPGSYMVTPMVMQAWGRKAAR